MKARYFGLFCCTPPETIHLAVKENTLHALNGKMAEKVTERNGDPRLYPRKR